MSMESDENGNLYGNAPQCAPRAAAKPSHVGTRHIGQELGTMAERKAVGKGIGRNKPVTTFPHEGMFNAGVAGKALTMDGNQVFYSCNTFCAWGLSGHQKRFQELLKAAGDSSSWTLEMLNQRNIDFFITKDVVLIQGTKELTSFGVRSQNVGSVLVNHEALQHLGVDNLQAAVNPSGRGWRPVTSANKYKILSVNGEEMALKTPSGAMKIVNYGLLLVAMVVETVFFAMEWNTTSNKALHTAGYVAQLGLTVGGFCACSAVSQAMVIAGKSAVVAGVASFGVGLVFVAAGVGVSLLVAWISSLLKKQHGVYHHTLKFHELMPLFCEDHVFEDNSLFQGVDEMRPAEVEFDNRELFAHDSFASVSFF